MVENNHHGIVPILVPVGKNRLEVTRHAFRPLSSIGSVLFHIHSTVKVVVDKDVEALLTVLDESGILHRGYINSRLLVVNFEIPILNDGVALVYHSSLIWRKPITLDVINLYPGHSSHHVTNDLLLVVLNAYPEHANILVMLEYERYQTNEQLGLTRFLSSTDNDVLLRAKPKEGIELLIPCRYG